MEKEKYSVYINRELSWLSFNERVLEEAESSLNPLFERLNFCNIYNSNLDEFYMVRVGSLLDQTFLDKVIKDSKTGMTPQQQIEAINKRVHTLLKRKEYAYFSNMKELERYGITHVSPNYISKDLELSFEQYFNEHIAHLLSPQIVDKHHPFPFLENKKIYVGVILQFKNTLKLGIIPIENYIERLITIKDSEQTYFMTVEELIYHFIDKIFVNKEIVTKTIFRVTRNTDIDTTQDLSEQEVDYIEFMQELLKKRRKLAPVRLEFQYQPDHTIIHELCSNLELTKEEVFIQDAPLDLSFIFIIKSYINNKQELFYDKIVSSDLSTVNKQESLCAQIKKKDVLLHYPYNSMKYLIKFLNQCAEDSQVISIRITLYRMARESEVISALIKAAENGIDVGVVVELRARFDEYNNIEWSKKLEEAGCKVVYGIEGYKVHSKLLLVTRKNESDIEYFTHIGTGNFNEKTAKFYTDIALFTAQKGIGIEASVIFNGLFTGEFVESTKHLLVAPKCLRGRIVELIDREIAFAKQGEGAEIFLKMNSLTDKLLINKLIEASQAGVKITMVIRGICCLRPEIHDVTDNITVISIVGRFLEHSRIYIFGTKERADVYISSADFMTRNTQKRVEVAGPVYDKDCKKKIFEWAEILCRDNVKARVLHSDGRYTYKTDDNKPLEAQMYLIEWARKQLETEIKEQEAQKKASADIEKNKQIEKTQESEQEQGSTKGLLQNIKALLGIK